MAKIPMSTQQLIRAAKHFNQLRAQGVPDEQAGTVAIRSAHQDRLAADGSYISIPRRS